MGSLVGMHVKICSLLKKSRNAFQFLLHDVVYGSDITTCNKIDKALMVYSQLMLHIDMHFTLSKVLTFHAKRAIFK